MKIEYVLRLFTIKCNNFFYIPYYCRSVFTNEILKNKIIRSRRLYRPRTIFLLSYSIKHPLIDDLEVLSTGADSFIGYFGGPNGLTDRISNVRTNINFLTEVLEIIDKYDPNSLKDYLEGFDYELNVGEYNRIKALPNNINKLEQYFNLFNQTLENDGSVLNCFNILLKYYRINVNPYEKLLHFSTLYDASGDDVETLLQYINFIVNNFERPEINNIFRIGINKTIDWINTNNRLQTINPNLWATNPIDNSVFGGRDILLDLQTNFIL
jgi:hypothetical protein